MNKLTCFQRVLFLLVGMLLAVPGSGFGALNDEIAQIQSSVKGCLMCNEKKIEEEAKRLADVYGKEVIQFTESNYRMANSVSNFVLLRAITKLPDTSAVQDALYNIVMSGKVFSHYDVFTAISFCERDVLLNIAFRLAQNTTSRQTGKSALDLMELFGDKSSISQLMQLEVHSKDKNFKDAISAVWKNIEERINWSPEMLQDWDRYSIPYWCIPREVPDIHNVTAGFFVQAELLNRRGFCFPEAFLKDQLSKSDPLAAALLVLQRGSSSIEDLKKHLSDDGVVQSVCRWGIEHLKDQREFNHAGWFDSICGEE